MAAPSSNVHNILDHPPTPRHYLLAVEFGSAGSFTIAYTDAFAYHRKRFFEQSKDYTLGFISKISAAGLLSAQELFTAQEVRKRLSASFEQAFSKVDIILTPTNPYPAHPIGTKPPQSDMRSFARPVSLAGLPALSIPCGFTKQGLPVGMQLIGRKKDEDMLLRAGISYEKATAWHTVKPPIGPGELWEPALPDKMGDENVSTSWVLEQATALGLNFIDGFLAERILDYVAPVKAMLHEARKYLEKTENGFLL